MREGNSDRKKVEQDRGGDVEQVAGEAGATRPRKGEGNGLIDALQGGPDRIGNGATAADPSLRLTGEYNGGPPKRNSITESKAKSRWA